MSDVPQQRFSAPQHIQVSWALAVAFVYLFIERVWLFFSRIVSSSRFGEANGSGEVTADCQVDGGCDCMFFSL